jgi:hypothetical protein
LPVQGANVKVWRPLWCGPEPPPDAGYDPNSEQCFI